MSRIQVQPQHAVWVFKNKWDIGLCGCVDDIGLCCQACFCVPCFLCRLHSRTDECPCTWCLPGGTTSLRTKIRTAFRIQGGICDDAVITCCCPCCSVIQMYHQLGPPEEN